MAMTGTVTKLYCGTLGELKGHHFSESVNNEGYLVRMTVRPSSSVKGERDRFLKSSHPNADLLYGVYTVTLHFQSICVFLIQRA